MNHGFDKVSLVLFPALPAGIAQRSVHRAYQFRICSPVSTQKRFLTTGTPVIITVASILRTEARPVTV